MLHPIEFYANWGFNRTWIWLSNKFGSYGEMNKGLHCCRWSKVLLEILGKSTSIFHKVNHPQSELKQPCIVQRDILRPNCSVIGFIILLASWFMYIAIVRKGKTVRRSSSDLIGILNWFSLTKVANWRIEASFSKDCLMEKLTTFLEKNRFSSRTVIIDLSTDFQKMKSNGFVYGLPEVNKII